MLTDSSASVLKPKIGSTPPVTAALVKFTTCARGRTITANPCAASGRAVRGKNVPDKNSIGVTKRKAG